MASTSAVRPVEPSLPSIVALQRRRRFGVVAVRVADLVSLEQREDGPAG
jgi:hypothetical protein